MPQYDWIIKNGIETLPISQAEYARYIAHEECRFFGVRADDEPDLACGNCWGITQRTRIALALSAARDLIEQQLGFSLSRTAETGEMGTGERQYWDYNIRLNKAHLYSLGVYEYTAEVNRTLDWTDTDPASISFTTDCGVDAIEVLYPDEEEVIRIQPSSITKSGTTMTIEIPRCRLVKKEIIEVSDDLETCVDYETDSNFLTTVDTRCRSINCTTPLNLIWLSSDVLSSSECGEVTQAGCGSVVNRRLSIIRPSAATWTGASFTVSSLSYCVEPIEIAVSYIAGLHPLPEALRQGLVRLAHSLMPAEPCGCELSLAAWKRDREEAPVVAKETCPWGMTAGAYYAWKSLDTYRVGDGGLLSAGMI